MYEIRPVEGFIMVSDAHTLQYLVSSGRTTTRFTVWSDGEHQRRDDGGDKWNKWKWRHYCVKPVFGGKSEWGIAVWGKGRHFISREIFFSNNICLNTRDFHWFQHFWLLNTANTAREANIKELLCSENLWINMNANYPFNRCVWLCVFVCICVMPACLSGA